mmetsp:Transcript_6474/g.8935  ORF Transcript_6474/g.8935 Transcript_6474/m.8935 type:complete len:338 (-) Transcript_6474:510-1523(-)|eukprot:CAMPEP_0184479486 /NCGR_PEP_ID=MMETSP0113_2-20130426/1196_1 /TAXON_ID=91329 /ORGANISM="Norrisiella sphaerica, Strain BC52" /LENGTH=337 /DNA_ID=CAMNT_0026857585 /DNA_START=160 /DNA_END=1173 /DNA_ORIENTATION=+
MSTEKDVINFLDSFLVSEIAKEKNNLYFVTSDTTVEGTLQELARRKILSVPVLDKKTNQFCGIVSVSDIVVAIVFNPCFAKLSNGGCLDKLTRKDMEEIIERSVLKNSVVDVIGVTEEGKNLWTFDESESLSKLAEYFAQGVHRALITRKSGGPCLISQTDCARFIHSKIKASKSSAVKKILDADLNSLGYVKGTDVVTVKDTETALHGFRRLLQWHSFRDWNLAALPVVDSKTGKIVGNLSESDLRGMNENRLLDLLFVIPMYMKTFYGIMGTPLTVTTNTTFKDAVDKLIEAKVHRLWVVDADEKPVGAFSLSDIISQFTPFSWSHMEECKHDES